MNSFGKEGEESAAEFIKGKDFSILRRNYRYSRSGEIDIIAKKDNLILFIEVKNRNSSCHGGALYSISNKKKRALRFVASRFIEADASCRDGNITFRFDLIAIENGRIEWVEDIIR